jgi:hypothetical protein
MHLGTGYERESRHEYCLSHAPPGMLALLITGTALAQDGEQIVPCKDTSPTVMTAFAKAYPKALRIC